MYILLLNILVCMLYAATITDTFSLTPQQINDDTLLASGIEVKWFTQKLDHNVGTDARTFQQRYLENRDRFKEGGHIILFVSGNEDPIAEYIAGGPLFELAYSYDALLINLEHRFIGRSQPFNGKNLTSDNLKYLSVEQALADIAYFIEGIKKSEKELNSSKVILVGSHYSASLVTWFRMKYPELTVGAWASSANTFVQLDAPEIKDTVGDFHRSMYGVNCWNKIRSAFEEMELLLNWLQETQKIEDNFKLCNKIDVSNKNDIMYFFHTISSLFTNNIIDHDYTYISTTCDTMLGIEDNIRAIATALYPYITKGLCFDANYNSAIKTYKNIYDEGENRVNLHMQCTQGLVWFTSAASRTQPFGYLPTFDLFLNMCKDVFDSTLTVEKLQQRVDRINLVYGGLNPNVTNVYTTQGSYDPYSRFGLQRNLTATALATTMKLAMRSDDLRWWLSNSTTYPDVVAARAMLKELVVQWMI